MTNETRCEPPPKLRNRDGLHWVQADAERLHTAKWSSRDEWWDFIHISGSAWEIGQLGYHYVAPVTPPATVAALVEALEAADQFIRNGIELGFIRMPDAGTPDPALKTPAKIAAALALYRGEAGR